MRVMLFAAAVVLTAAGLAPLVDVQTYAEKLGFPKGAKVVIFHVDDAGMHHDANVGTIEAMEKGVATSASIMFPCPWVPDIVKYAKERPESDFGLHCTLTSEWGSYRWGPVAGKAAVPGLVDEEGCLWPEVEQVAAKATPDEVEKELRAQLDRSLTMGWRPTHLDTHMGTVFATMPFMERYVKIGAEYGIPVMAPGGHGQYVAAEDEKIGPLLPGLGQMVWSLGLPVLDDVHTGYGVKDSADKKAQIIAFLREMKPGLTQFIVHATRHAEHFKEVTGSGPMRLAELEALTSPAVKQVVEEEKVILTTWRELKQRRDAAK